MTGRDIPTSLNQNNYRRSGEMGSPEVHDFLNLLVLFAKSSLFEMAKSLFATQPWSWILQNKVGLGRCLGILYKDQHDSLPMYLTWGNDQKEFFTFSEQSKEFRGRKYPDLTSTSTNHDLLIDEKGLWPKSLVRRHFLSTTWQSCLKKKQQIIK